MKKPNQSAISDHKREFRDPTPTHARTAAVYINLSHKNDAEAIKNREDAVLLARLRSGHFLAAYRHLLNPREDPDPCGPARINDAFNLVEGDKLVVEGAHRNQEHTESQIL